MKLSDTDIYMLERLCEKYHKKSFDIEDAKKYFKEDEHFTTSDFDISWQKLFNPANIDDSYIGRNGNNFILLHKGLLYTPKPKEKEPWTHAEIIALCSAAVSVVIAILGVIF